MLGSSFNGITPDIPTFLPEAHHLAFLYQVQWMPPVGGIASTP